MSNDSEQWLTASEAAQVLKVSPRQVHRYAEQRQLRTRRAGRRVLFSAASVATLADELAVDVRPPPPTRQIDERFNSAIVQMDENQRQIRQQLEQQAQGQRQIEQQIEQQRIQADNRFNELRRLVITVGVMLLIAIIIVLVVVTLI